MEMPATRRLLLQFVIVLITASAGCAAECVLQPGSALRVALPADASMRAKPGTVLTGPLSRTAYSGTCKAISEGAQVRAAVGEIEHRGIGTVMFGVLKRLAGMSGKPRGVTLRSVEIDIAGIGITPVSARFLRMEKVRRQTASGKGRKAEGKRVLLLEIEKPLSVPLEVEPARAAAGGTVPAGTTVLVDLTTPLHSARSGNGDVFRARLAEPVIVDGQVMAPEGTVVEGVVAQSKRARRPYRAGRLRMSFHTLRIPGRQDHQIAVSATGGELANANTLDAEGGFTGGALNRKQALLNIAVAYVTGKLLDDIIEESAKGALGAAVAGSAETAARYVGLAAGTAMFLMHRGRDVSLESQTELQLTFTRDLQLSQ